MYAVLNNLKKRIFKPKTEPKNIVEALHDVVFPGEVYKQENKGALVKNLRRLADAIEGEEEKGPQSTAATRKMKERKFDFSKYGKRYVALELMYLGHDYSGFARQESAEHTIEEYLFAALRKTKLIESHSTWKELEYSRGGRTDKGVSALGQVVALKLRSSTKAGEPLIAENDEMDYPALLNRVLPTTIRVLGWTTAPKDFSARFSADYREYKYFIIDKTNAPESLDLLKMKEAASAFVGEHDFRNFCKADVSKVRNFKRKIMNIELKRLAAPQASGQNLIELYICGTAFLWHQVRYMAEVLLMVGKRLEQPSIVRRMLDISLTQAKPQYAPASEEPLLLYSCSYSNISFRRSTRVYSDILGLLDEARSSHMIRSAIIESIEKRMADDAFSDPNAPNKRYCGPKHIPMLKRPVEPSLQERLKRLEDKKE